MKTLEQNLSRIDLNLLIALSVLLKEKNVSKAAQKLYVTQPAMSRTLARLRLLFDDPLFYRTANGLQPTDKALGLTSQLESILLSVEGLISSHHFEAQHCERTFGISTPPLMSRWLISTLATEIYKQAPKVALEEYPASMDSTTLLKDGLVDFSIHVQEPLKYVDYDFEKLGHTYPVIYGSKNHPLAKKEQVTLLECLDYSFADLSFDVRDSGSYLNPIDQLLHKQGIRRHIGLRSGQLSTLLTAIQNSDRLLIGGHFLSRDSKINQQFATIKVFNEPSFLVDVYLVEHRRTLTSTAHRWLRNLIKEALEPQFVSTMD
ncbi:LysR family transcriptional regulator [Shewanella waksmanii]|uniref:LysR family transcriptional regulator n=1 Tax=Shewanella waksmanii TaxID=213783 RepID=UPI00048EE99D|nr:LysR family transcriptional regulator [Shewanella waksmanii]